MVFIERELVRDSVHRSGRGEHELATSLLFLHALHQIQGALDVVSDDERKVFLRGVGWDVCVCVGGR